jgi:NAD(P)-dependent dehydrogenase (short-subunit alcohol dehydrogenase family)
VNLRSPVLSLDESAVVITGASSGIGKATAVRLASRGASLVLAARGAEALDETVRRCRAEGAEVIGVTTDVSDEREVALLAREAEDRFGRIDAWVNNAGVMAYGRFDEVPMDAHRQVVGTNLLGAMYGSAEALRRFRRQGRGVIVNVASLYAEMTTPFVSSYVTSKFGLLGLSRVLQRDLRPEGDIHVCAVLPSSIDTPIFRHAANYHGRETRAIPPVASPSRVARAIVSCLEHPKGEVRIGWIGRLFALGEKLVPGIYGRVVNPVMRTVGFTAREEPANGGNVFEAGREWQQVDGEWRNTGARRAAVLAAALAAAGATALLRER